MEWGSGEGRSSVQTGWNSSFDVVVWKFPLSYLFLAILNEVLSYFSAKSCRFPWGRAELCLMWVEPWPEPLLSGNSHPSYIFLAILNDSAIPLSSVFTFHEARKGGGVLSNVGGALTDLNLNGCCQCSLFLPCSSHSHHQ